MSEGIEARVREIRKEIVSCIKEPTIVSHLQAAAVLSSEEGSRLKNLYLNGDTYKAGEELLECVFKSDEPGKWKSFEEALESADYYYLKSLLSTSNNYDELSIHAKTMIRLFTPVLEMGISATSIMPELISKYVLNSTDQEFIMSMYATKGTICSTIALLERMQCRVSPQKWYYEFLNALVHNGYEYLVQEMEPDFISNPNKFLPKLGTVGTTDEKTNRNKRKFEDEEHEENGGSRNVSTDVFENISIDFTQDPRTREMYEKAIHEGQEKDTDIRVMVIGCHRQGKSSLVRRLTGKELEENTESTNGIDIHLLDQNWDEKIIDDAALDSAKRLALAAKVHSTLEYKEKRTSSENPAALSEIFQQSDVDTVDISKRSGDGQVVSSGISVSQAYNQQVNEEQTQSHIPVHVGQVSTQLKMISPDLIAFGKELIKNNSTATDYDGLNINIWDFGGQFVYYSTHQLFHSKQAIYLLVFNLALGLHVEIEDDDCPNRTHVKTMKDYLKFWVNSVHTFVGNEQGTEPPILLVGTHLDKLEKDADVDKCFEAVRKLFEDSKSIYHIRPENFAISNTEPCLETLRNICKTVINIGTEKSARCIIPAKWIPLERSLKENREMKIISMDKVREIDSRNEVSVGSDEQLKLFLQYHHEKGTFFYFENTEQENNHVVLQPQFLIDAFKCIITAERFCRVHPNRRKLWQKLTNEAILKRELLHELWANFEENEFINFEEALLYFLQKHRILAEALQFDDKDSGKHPVSLGFYIVPSLLKKSAGREMDEFLRGRNYTKTSIGYVFQDDTVLPTIYNRVTAAALGKWPLLKFQDQPMIFENVVGCQLSLDHAGLLKKAGDTLELLVVSLCPTLPVRPGQCDLFRRFVDFAIGQELHKFKMSNTKGPARQRHSMSVRCFNEEHAFNGSKDVYDFEILQNHKERYIGCPDNACHFLIIHEIMQQWFKEELFKDDIPKRRLTVKELSKLSMSIGNGWEHLGRQLGITDAELDHISLDKCTTVQRIYEMFRRWRNKRADFATLDVLVSAIQECKVLKVENDALKNLIDRI